MREYFNKNVRISEPHPYEIDFKSKVSVFLTVVAVTYLCSHAANIPSLSNQQPSIADKCEKSSIFDSRK